MQYECSLVDFENEMICQMVKVSIRRMEEPKDPTQALEHTLKYSKDQKPRDNCEFFSQFADKFRNYKPLHWNSMQVELNEQRKQDEIRNWTAQYNDCIKPSAATATEKVRAHHHTRLRTCRISSQYSSLKFKRIEKDTWVANAGPAYYDQCGSVEMSRFEKSKLPLADGWSYVVRTTVANPNGVVHTTGESCRAFETEYTYEAAGIDHYARCDYIKFEQWSYPELSPPGSILNHRLEEVWERRK